MSEIGMWVKSTLIGIVCTMLFLGLVLLVCLLPSIWKVLLLFGILISIVTFVVHNIIKDD